MKAGAIKPVVAIALFLAVLGALAVRQYHNLLDPAEPHAPNWGMADFRDVIYYPTVALLEGDNPYDSRAFMSDYPVGNVFPLYTPHLLLLFLPFGMLPFALSGTLFWLLLVATYPVFAALCLKVCDVHPRADRVFFLATAILVSVPGRWAFDVGQLAALWSMATIFALQHAATRPRFAGLALVLAACKPTFGVPLALFLLVQRRFKPVLWGTGIATLASVVVLVVILAGSGWDSVWTVLDQNQSVLEAAQPFDPARSHTRVDANVFVQQVLDAPGGRWTEMAVFATALLLAAAVLRRSDTVRPASAAGALVLLAMVIGVYHQTYDAVLLVVVPVAVFSPARRQWRETSRPMQMIIALLSTVPVLNVSWTTTFGMMLQRGFDVSETGWEEILRFTGTLNSTACFLAFCTLAAIFWTKRPGSCSTV